MYTLTAPPARAPTSTSPPHTPLYTERPNVQVLINAHYTFWQPYFGKVIAVIAMISISLIVKPAVKTYDSVLCKREHIFHG